MKFPVAILSAVLSAIFLIVPVSAQAPPAAQAKLAEYNISVCTSKGFGIVHIVVDKKTISFVNHATVGGEVVTEKEPTVFTIITDEKNPDIDARDIDAVIKQNDAEVHIFAVVSKDQFIGAVVSDDILLATVYGRAGSIDGVFDESDVRKSFCLEQSSTSPEDAIRMLHEWMLTGKYPAPPDTPDLKKD